MQAYPLAWPAGWPRTSEKKHGRFNRKEYKTSVYSGSRYLVSKDLSIADAVERIRYELERLGAGDFVISSNLALRRDGFPKSDQGEPADAGAAVYWEDEKGRRRVMAIDLYKRVADNLAAIAATLEAMRAIERHGGAQILDRAFTGFIALPAPENFDPWAILGLPYGASAAKIQLRFRELAPLCHPDRGGSIEAFQRLERARREALQDAGA